MCSAFFPQNKKQLGQVDGLRLGFPQLAGVHMTGAALELSFLDLDAEAKFSVCLQLGGPPPFAILCILGRSWGSLASLGGAST